MAVREQTGALAPLTQAVAVVVLAVSQALLARKAVLAAQAWLSLVPL